MSYFFQIHPSDPQARLIKKSVEVIRGGGVVAVPTDSCYALVCRLDDKNAAQRLRTIRGINDKHHLTLLCHDLSELAAYARVDNWRFRILKAATPGAFTFILPASKEVPRRVSHPSRKTIGLRVPDNNIVQALLEELGEPLLATTLIMPGDDDPITDPDEIQDRLEKHVDLIVDGGACSFTPTTVVDMSGDELDLVRKGRGDVRLLGF